MKITVNSIDAALAILGGLELEDNEERVACRIICPFNVIDIEYDRTTARRHVTITKKDSGLQKEWENNGRVGYMEAFLKDANPFRSLSIDGDEFALHTEGDEKFVATELRVNDEYWGIISEDCDYPREHDFSEWVTEVNHKDYDSLEKRDGLGYNAVVSVVQNFNNVPVTMELYVHSSFFDEKVKKYAFDTITVQGNSMEEAQARLDKLLKVITFNH